MHSFHPSRGRILFEVLCALTVSASCAGAWVQTGASALLPAAFAAALYGLWHLTDMRRPKPAMAAAVAVPAVEEAADPVEKREPIEAAEPMTLELPEPEAAAEEPARVARPKRKSRKKKSETPVAAEPAMPEPEVAEPAAPVIELFEPVEEHQVPIAPLFEPQPMVRQQRTVFGRKAG